jgi:hypothetical protein
MAASATAATTGGDARAAMVSQRQQAKRSPCRRRNMFGAAVTIADMAMAGVGPAGTGVATLGVGVLAGAAAGDGTAGLGVAVAGEGAAGTGRLARWWLAREQERDARAVAQSPAALACCAVTAVF